jgi:hypothetical protein
LREQARQIAEFPADFRTALDAAEPFRRHRQHDEEQADRRARDGRRSAENCVYDVTAVACPLIWAPAARSGFRATPAKRTRCC